MIDSIALPLSQWLKSVSLDAAGLVALADLVTIARRTALVGTAHILDCLVICPGLHRQQSATSLHNGEIPPMAAMSTGYICRVENPATISYLQQIGRTGHLTVVNVQRRSHTGKPHTHPLRKIQEALISCSSSRALAAYLSIVVLTCSVILLFIISASWRSLGALGALILARLSNVMVVRRRNAINWHGAREPGTKGDNLVLLSQDRWIRLRGDLDDLKVVTSGQWLRDPTFFERTATAFATVLVYMTAALASNIEAIGKLAILILLLISVGLLSIANEYTDTLDMHGRVLSLEEPQIPYERRLAMVSDLIAEVGRDDWAVRMGLIIENCRPCSPISIRSTTSDCKHITKVEVVPGAPATGLS